MACLIKVRFGGLHSLDCGETRVLFNTLECDVGNGNCRWIGQLTSIGNGSQPDCPIIVAVVEMWHVALCEKP